MKHTTLPVWLLLSAFTANAQQSDTEPRTLFGSKAEHKNGGWGGPAVALTEVMDKPALLTGLKAGWIIDHRFTLGIGGYGMVTDMPNKGYDEYLLGTGAEVRRTSQFRMGYGGLLLEPVIAYKSPVHVTLPILIGAGGCGYETSTTWEQMDDSTHYDDWRNQGQAFFVVEPGVEVELSLVRFVRVGIGTSYRYTSDIDLPGTPVDALRGLNTSFSIKIGRF
ncbi:MAG: hypothetical protein ABI599_06030 [Flavobacteriales bacterium]